MIYTLKRDLSRLTKSYTMGEIVLEGAHLFTLEDPLVYDPTPDASDDDALANAKGKTCIPFGRYELVLYNSARNKRLVPLLLEVPGRSMIEIHILNTAEDTEGCIGVGLNRSAGRITRSREAFDQFMNHFTVRVHREKCYLNIIADLPEKESAHP